MKTTVRLLSIAYLFMGSLGVVSVAEAETLTSQALTYPDVPSSREAPLPAISITEISVSKDAVTSASGQDASIASSASPLQYLEVTGVYSVQYGGWEDIPPSLTTSVGDHGGTTMVVETLEVGYGNNPIATMNGGQLSGPYDTTAVCWDPYGQLVYCSAGLEVAGWFKYWNVSGYQNGYFTYQNTSINSPWNTMSDALSIR